jgi:RNA polymerase sigma factor FliA
MNAEANIEALDAGMNPAERERLLLENLPEVRFIARRIHERLPVQVPFEDLVHAGIVGLIEAIDRFDPKKQVHLKTFAKFRIRGAILDSLRAIDWSPRSLRKQSRAIEDAYRNLSTELGRAPSEVELASKVGMGLLEFQKLMGELHGLSMGSLQVYSNDDSPEEEAILYQPNGPEEDPFFQCLQSEMKSRLTDAMTVLEEKERQVVGLYYFDELTMKEVGAVLGVTESRVSQIHALALVRLRTHLQEAMQPHGNAAGEPSASAISSAP